jgi:hypothetical protein
MMRAAFNSFSIFRKVKGFRLLECPNNGADLLYKRNKIYAA